MSYLVEFRQRKAEAHKAILWCFKWPNLVHIISDFLAMEVDFQWREHGGAVIINGDIAELCGESASALLNQVEISTCNKHRLAIKCLKNGTSCNYIGVVDPLKVQSLDENLQWGTSGAIIALDGNCRILHEGMIEYRYHKVSRGWEDGSLIELEVDNLNVVFYIDGHLVHTSKVPKNVAVLTYVIGFGASIGEKYEAMYYTME